MSMNKWAEREVQLACKRENPDWDGKSFDYGCHCYGSALKAYKSICEDDHSGMSFGITRNILIRLLNEIPLTPIEDVPEVWNEVTYGRDNITSYQCSRMFSLFKEVDENGNVSYHDNDRYYCIDVNTKLTYSGGGVGNLLDKLYPIRMPYYPTVNKFKVYTDEFIAEGFPGDDEDYNTRAVLYLITPEGEKVEINRYFADSDTGLVEISKGEYKKRLKHRKEK